MMINCETTTLLDDLQKVSDVRSQMANHLNEMVKTLEKGESMGENLSGKLELSQDIDDLQKIGSNLKSGLFRLLVLGDMKLS
ncbi:MAG: dynamin, partial [Crocosphaera sp.]